MKGAESVNSHRFPMGDQIDFLTGSHLSLNVITEAPSD